MKHHPDPTRAGDGNSTVAPPPATGTLPLAVKATTHVDQVTTVRLWWLYQKAFTEINGLAAQRHLMTFEEFYDLMNEPRVVKFIAKSGQRMVGLSVMTSDLTAWSLVAPEFYEQRYPGRQIFYIGFVGTDQTEGAYVALIARMYEDVMAADGVCAMDFAGHNVDQLKIGRKVNALLRRTNPRARGGMVDRQEFWAWDFRGGRAAPDTAPYSPEVRGA